MRLVGIVRVDGVIEIWDCRTCRCCGAVRVVRVVRVVESSWVERGKTNELDKP